MSIARPFIRLDATFFDDPKVIEVSEGAQLLFIAMLCRAAMLRSDGVLTGAQVKRLGIEDTGLRLGELGAVGLIERLEDTSWLIPNYSKWQKTQTDYQKEAERKRVRRTSGGHDADVRAVSSGHGVGRPESVRDKKRKDKEKNEGENRTVAPTLAVVGDVAQPAEPSAIAEILKAHGLRRAAE